MSTVIIEHYDDKNNISGGIGVKFQLTQMQFVNPFKIEASDIHSSRVDGPRELTLQRRFNHFLLGVLRQAWRVKRHPLQIVDELPVLLEKMPRLPICQLIAGVINLLEDKDRRIVAIDCDKELLVSF
jgi:hypothetical protein